jgi:hypothetical protein
MIKLCLGLHITRDHAVGTFRISQDQYIAQTLSKYKMDACKPTNIPMILTEVKNLTAI